MSLSIADLAARTGVQPTTLRMWEHRHGFPEPRRLPGGHRRYDEADVARVARVLRERAAGLSLAAAIERVRDAVVEQASIFAGLRRRRPELEPVVLRKPALLALTRALEDESCARAERALLFGAFQHERFYRRSQRRWRDLARTAGAAVVFADFAHARVPARSPAEIPLERVDPLTREWAIVCEAPGHAACLAGLELPDSTARRDAAREFEVIWSVEPEVVRTATHVCLALARRASARLAHRLPDADALPTSGPPAGEQLRLAAAITIRAFGRMR